MHKFKYYPQNFKRMRDADITLEQINSICGDKVIFYFKIRDKKIADVSFTGSGCVISIASASIFSEYLKGRSVETLDKITGKKILDLMGASEGFPPARLKCAFLPLEIVRKLRDN